MGEPESPQPPEQPATTPTSGGTADAAPAMRPAPRRRLARSTLLTVAIVLGVLAVVGVGAALFVYDRATQLDRRSPTVAVRQFVYAAFLDRDEARATLFACEGSQVSATVIKAMSALRPNVKVSLGLVTEKGRGDGSALVTAEIEYRSNGFTDVRTWEFDTADQQGWRVCDARQIA